MAREYRLDTGDLHSRFYSGFGGLTKDAGAVDPPYRMNVYRDYESGGEALESIPGFRKIAELEGEILDLHAWRCGGALRLVVHAGYTLWLFSEKGGEGKRLTGLLDNRRGAFIPDGEDFYYLDGQGYFRYEGKSGKFYEIDDATAYLPIAYYNGEPYEQRNLLSRRFALTYSTPCDRVYEGTSEGLLFRVYDEDAKSCELYAVDSLLQGVLSIPEAVSIDGEEYVVRRIASAACGGMKGLTALRLPPVLEEIGTQAFRGCTGLTEVRIPDSVYEIGASAFYGCPLRAVYLGLGIKTLRAGAIPLASSPEIYYAGTREEFERISHQGAGNLLSYLSEQGEERLHTSYTTEDDGAVLLFFPLCEACEEILSVTLGGELLTTDPTAELSYGTVGTTGISALSLSATHRGSLFGKELKITVSAPQGGFGGGRALPDVPDLSRLVRGCRLAAEFDGRIFLSGNPDFPHGVLFSTRRRDGVCDPTYFGVYDYFADGAKNSPVASLLPMGDSLFVFKDGASDGGGIFLHRGQTADDALTPRIYPSEEGLTGGLAVGEAICYLDTPIFLSERGVTALTKATLDSERSVETRSFAIDRMIRGERLGKMRLAVWRGYLLLLTAGGRLYLGDARQTYTHGLHTEYAWYPLSDIGVYRGQYPRFRYAERLPFGVTDVELSPNAGEYLADPRAVTSHANGEGTLYTHRVTDENGVTHAYLCDSDGEMTGGEFSPATAILSTGELLYFGCVDGSICLFNTDLPRENGLLPSEAYSFNGRRYLAGFSTSPDDCDIPHLTKSSVKRSAVLRAKTFDKSRIRVRVRTDREGYEQVANLSGGCFDFGRIDFSFFTFGGGKDGVYVLPEQKKRWVRKQYYFYSEDYEAPFGICSLAFRYRVSGRVKEN